MEFPLHDIRFQKNKGMNLFVRALIAEIVFAQY